MWKWNTLRGASNAHMLSLYSLICTFSFVFSIILWNRVVVCSHMTDAVIVLLIHVQYMCWCCFDLVVGPLKLRIIMPGLRKTQLAARDRVANGTPMPMKRGRMTDKENVDPQGIQTPKGTREVTGLCVEAGNSVKAGVCSVTNSIISAGFIQTPSPRERQGLAPTPETSPQLEIACRTCNSILFAQNGPGCGVLLSSSHSFNVL